MKLIMENWREFILNEAPSTGKWVGCPENHYRDPKTGRCKSMVNTGFAFVPAGVVTQAVLRAAPSLARSKEALAMAVAVVSQQISDLISDDPTPQAFKRVVPPRQVSDKLFKKAIDDAIRDVMKDIDPDTISDEDELPLGDWDDLDDDEKIECAFASPKMLEVTTNQDRTTRSVVVVRHPGLGDVTAYFKSSGVSGTGAEGRWIPFEGWVTEERVPKGLSYGNGEGRLVDPETGQRRALPYGAYALMAKTYYGHPEYPTPMGTRHDFCSRWLSYKEAAGELMKLEKVYMTIEHIRSRDGWLKSYPQYAKLNKSLMKYAAIDRSRPIFKRNRKGRRLLFGVDEIS